MRFSISASLEYLPLRTTSSRGDPERRGTHRLSYTRRKLGAQASNAMFASATKLGKRCPKASRLRRPMAAGVDTRWGNGPHWPRRVDFPRESHGEKLGNCAMIPGGRGRTDDFYQAMKGDINPMSQRGSRLGLLSFALLINPEAVLGAPSSEVSDRLHHPVGEVADAARQLGSEAD